MSDLRLHLLIPAKEAAEALIAKSTLAQAHELTLKMLDDAAGPERVWWNAVLDELLWITKRPHLTTEVH